MVHYKQLQSSHPKLYVRRAGKRHTCVGIAVERGARPGKLKDVWMFGRSKRCSELIEIPDLYIANAILPPSILDSLSPDRWLPTCVTCAIETYGEYFEGPVKAQFLKPISREHRQMVQRGLVNMLQEAREMAVVEDEGHAEAA